MLYPTRFKTTLDECVHIVIALVISNIYAEQKQDMIDIYGVDIVEKAYFEVTNQYSALLARF